jgi:peptidoglycan hydrolase CwlO-like protein
VSVGRSTGVVDNHRHIALSRPNVKRFVALACMFALVSLPGVAHAQSTHDRLAETRKEIDATAQRWFDAQSNAQVLDARIGQLEHDIASADARVASAREVATARALLMYKGASLEYASVFGSTVIESARRAELIDRANAHNEAAINELTTSLAELRAQRRDLVATRARQEKALHAVASQRDALDAQLASLQEQAARENQAGARAPSRRVRSIRSVPVAAAAATAAPTGPVRRAPASASFVPPTGGVSPHHNDPFLVCTRARESGGNYGIVSSGGSYYGAYQFLPSTWNATAAHAGRIALVGVLPSRASMYDQDEMAWVLYQWQGKGPWGGRC